MKPLFVLGTLGLLLISLNCYNNSPSAQGTSDNWNSVRSDWTSSESYDADSPEASEALNDLSTSSPGNTSTNIDHFQIILQSVTTNGDGTQTWTYAISKIANGPSAKDLSHFTLLFNNCTGSNIVNSYGGSYGPDGSATQCTSGQDGLKWDRSVSAGETVLYTFTTDKVYEVGSITGLVKYGTSCNTGTLPGPDCSKEVGTTPDNGGNDGNTGGGGTGENPPPPPKDNCPSWIDTLNLTTAVKYKNYHGYNYLGFPVYYIGETMHSDLTICNNTSDTATKLKIKTIVTKHPNTGLACGQPVQTWTGVTIGAHDCLTLDHSFFLATTCPWGNYESHIIIAREADGDCPVTATLVADNGAIGFFDP